MTSRVSIMSSSSAILPKKLAPSELELTLMNGPERVIILLEQIQKDFHFQIRTSTKATTVRTSMIDFDQFLSRMLVQHSPTSPLDRLPFGEL